jgi:hypothetical protein
MSFGLVVFDKAHLSTVYNFANANGVRTRPLDTVREISLDGDGVWELSKLLPRLFVESHAQEDGCTYWFLELEHSVRHDRALAILNGHADHVFRKVFVDEYISGCRMKDSDTGHPVKKRARLTELVFWPVNHREQNNLTQFIEGKLPQAA